MIIPFDLLDLFIVIGLLGATIKGSSSGSLRLFFTLSGMIGGILFGAFLAPYASSYVPTPLAKMIVVVLVILGITAGLTTIGEFFGQYAARKAENIHLELADTLIGAMLSGTAYLTAVWLVANMFVGNLSPAWNKQINNSGTIALFDKYLPPAPSIVTRLEATITPNGFPQVYTGLEPKPDGPISPATAKEVASAVAAAGPSTVKIQGFGCGGLVSGSGFIVAPGLVATNAHVVAGIPSVSVDDANGSHNASVLVFDPNLDMAVLAVGGLAGSPLPIVVAQQRNGTHVIALGYPGGGVFTSSAANIIDERQASGRNIYNSGLVTRVIYELNANIEPGNSGGPLVRPDGTVVGLVFAKSTTNPNLGYALTADQLMTNIHKAQIATSSANTGNCAVD